MSENGTIASTHEFREELDTVVDRTRDASFIHDSRDSPTHSVPNDDEPWSVADILGEMMAGAYTRGDCIEVFGYKLYSSALDETMPNVWTVHPPEDADGERAVDARISTSSGRRARSRTTCSKGNSTSPAPRKGAFVSRAIEATRHGERTMSTETDCDE